ncbi:hypothetical protein [Ferrimonas aestuarii]|uniref:Uncharacterized protein n=1 Tax=Ferrimonas aestuarii TaxID=2569539 RepID=A0A4U1BQB0_9GAMM|nr:hypothetical protein [Ferrimonas aestuarii]TKB53303.1 hypothetical protein FCL42_14630 [Ferrimonas aestuarii]
MAKHITQAVLDAAHAKWSECADLASVTPFRNRVKPIQSDQLPAIIQRMGSDKALTDTLRMQTWSLQLELVMCVDADTIADIDAELLKLRLALTQALLDGSNLGLPYVIDVSLTEQDRIDADDSGIYAIGQVPLWFEIQYRVADPTNPIAPE